MANQGGNTLLDFLLEQQQDKHEARGILERSQIKQRVIPRQIQQDMLLAKMEAIDKAEGFQEKRRKRQMAQRGDAMKARAEQSRQQNQQQQAQAREQAQADAAAMLEQPTQIGQQPSRGLVTDASGAASKIAQMVSGGGGVQSQGGGGGGVMPVQGGRGGSVQGQVQGGGGVPGGPPLDPYQSQAAMQRPQPGVPGSVTNTVRRTSSQPLRFGGGNLGTVADITIAIASAINPNIARATRQVFTSETSETTRDDVLYENTRNAIADAMIRSKRTRDPADIRKVAEMLSSATRTLGPYRNALLSDVQGQVVRETEKRYQMRQQQAAQLATRLPAGLTGDQSRKLLTSVSQDDWGSAFDVLAENAGTEAEYLKSQRDLTQQLTRARIQSSYASTRASNMRSKEALANLVPIANDIVSVTGTVTHGADVTGNAFADLLADQINEDGRLTPKGRAQFALTQGTAMQGGRGAWLVAIEGEENSPLWEFAIGKLGEEVAVFPLNRTVHALKRLSTNPPEMTTREDGALGVKNAEQNPQAVDDLNFLNAQGVWFGDVRPDGRLSLSPIGDGLNATQALAVYSYATQYLPTVERDTGGSFGPPENFRGVLPPGAKSVGEGGESGEPDLPALRESADKKMKENIAGQRGQSVGKFLRNAPGAIMDADRRVSGAIVGADQRATDAARRFGSGLLGGLTGEGGAK